MTSPRLLRAVRRSRKLGPFFNQGLAVFSNLVGPLAVRHQRPLSRVQKRTGKQSHMDHITTEAGTAQGVAMENLRTGPVTQFIARSRLIGRTGRFPQEFRREWRGRKRARRGQQGGQPSAGNVPSTRSAKGLDQLRKAPWSRRPLRRGGVAGHAPVRARLFNSLNVRNARERTESAERLSACTQRKLGVIGRRTVASARVEHRVRGQGRQAQE
jgi:hypothetical protein